MENNILKHRLAVQQNIQKSFNSELGVESFDDIEKGKWNIGDTKVYQGVTYEVGGFNAKGTPLWRKAKGGATNSGGASSSQNNTASSSSSANKNVFSSTNDISKIPDKEYRKITNILEKYTPDKRYLDPEEMSDQELMNFKSVAESFVFSRKISKSTRDNCRKWSDLASDEVKRRKSSQNNATTNSSVSKKSDSSKPTNKDSTFAKNAVDKMKNVLKKEENTIIPDEYLKKIENAISNDEENAKKILSIKFPKTKDVDLKSPESEATKVVNLGDYEMICRTYKSYNFNISNGKSDPLVIENYSITLRNKVKGANLIRHTSSWIPGFYDKENKQQRCIMSSFYDYYKYKENL